MGETQPHDTESQNFVAPDESKRVIDKVDAESMARHSDKVRSIAAGLKKEAADIRAEANSPKENISFWEQKSYKKAAELLEQHAEEIDKNADEIEQEHKFLDRMEEANQKEGKSS